MAQTKVRPSTFVDGFGYSRRKRELTVTLKRGDEIVSAYVYKNVPPRIYAQMNAAESKGRFFNTSVKRQFDFDRVALKSAS